LAHTICPIQLVGCRPSGMGEVSSRVDCALLSEAIEVTKALGLPSFRETEIGECHSRKP